MTSRVSAGVGGLRVRVVDKGVGGEVTLAETDTDPRGGYRATFTDALLERRGKDRPDLQVQVYVADRRVAASEVRYDASPYETFTVVIEADAADALASEYETLTGSLGAHHSGRLADLKETDEQQDVTYLANKAGWDARAVALAALADQFSAGTEGRGGTGIEPSFFYALFRAGLPANDQSVYRTDPAAIEGIWAGAVKQGVIPRRCRTSCRLRWSGSGPSPRSGCSKAHRWPARRRSTTSSPSHSPTVPDAAGSPTCTCATPTTPRRSGTGCATASASRRRSGCGSTGSSPT